MYATLFCHKLPCVKICRDAQDRNRRHNISLVSRRVRSVKGCSECTMYEAECRVHPIFHRYHGNNTCSHPMHPFTSNVQGRQTLLTLAAAVATNPLQQSWGNTTQKTPTHTQTMTHTER